MAYSFLGGKFREIDSLTGQPLSGGLLYTYAAGTLTPLATYTDAGGLSANTNPVVLDSAGRADVFLGATSYRMILKSALGLTIWDEDNIPQFVFAQASTLAASSGSSTIGFIASGTGAVARTVQAKLRDNIHMRDFGALCDGTTNDSTALQAAHDAIAAAGGGRLYVSQAKLNSTFNWDANKVAIEGDGGQWDFSSLGAAAYAINVTQSEPDINLRCAKNRAHPFKGVRLVGPTGTTTINGINIADVTLNTICGVTFEHGACSGFIADVTFGAGAFFELFRDWDFTSDVAGHKSQRNVNFPASANSGERMVFDNCRFGLVVTENFSIANGNATVSCMNCSFNYAPRMATVSAGSLIICSGSHIEFSSDADWMFFLSSGGGNPSVIITETTFSIAAAKSLKGFAFVDSTVNTTGLTVRDCVLGATNPITVPWADGSGRVTVANVSRFTSTGYMFTPAIGQNMLAYGDFESASFSGEFNCQGTTIPARSTTQAKQGTNSLRFQGIAAQTNFADVSVPCTVGQTVNFSVWYRGDGVTGTSTGFQANMRYLDTAGVLLTTIPVFSVTADTAGWLLATPTASFACAPPGTKTAQLRTIIQGTASGTPLGYIDVVNMVAQ